MQQKHETKEPKIVLKMKRHECPECHISITKANVLHCLISVVVVSS